MNKIPQLFTLWQGFCDMYVIFLTLFGLFIQINACLFYFYTFIKNYNYIIDFLLDFLQIFCTFTLMYLSMISRIKILNLISIKS